MRRLPLAFLGLLALSACASAPVTLAKGQLVIDATFNSAQHWYMSNYQTLSPGAKATIKTDLTLLYDCRPAVPPATSPSCAGYIKDLHDAVAIGDLVALQKWADAISLVLQDAAKAGLPVTVPSTGSMTAPAAN